MPLEHLFEYTVSYRMIRRYHINSHNPYLFFLFSSARAKDPVTDRRHHLPVHCKGSGLWRANHLLDALFHPTVARAPAANHAMHTTAEEKKQIPDREKENRETRGKEATVPKRKNKT